MAEAHYDPHPQLRQVHIVPSQAALLFIDVQHYNCHRSGAIYRYAVAHGKDKVGGQWDMALVCVLFIIVHVVLMA